MKFSFLRPYGRILFLITTLYLPLQAHDDHDDKRGPAPTSLPSDHASTDRKPADQIPLDQDQEPLGAGDQEIDMPGDLAGLLGPMAGMDQDQLMGLLGGQGIDQATLQSLLADLGGGFGQELPQEAPPVPFDTFEEVVASYEKENPLPRLSDRDLELSYEGAESEAVEPLRSGEGKLAEKYHHFVTTTLKGKGKMTMLLFAFVIYRQATWIWREWWKESLRTPHLPQEHMLDWLMGVRNFPTSLGKISGTNIPSYGFWAFDLMFRSFFSVTHLWTGMQSWWETTQQILQGGRQVTPEQWSEHFSSLFIRMGRSRQFFSNPTFYGMNLSFGQEALVEMALPFAYAAFMSRDPLNHSIFNRAFAGMANRSIQHLGLRGYYSYHEKVSPKKQKNWFDKTLGVVRPSTIRDLASIVGTAVEALVLGQKYNPKKVIGTKVIELVYLYVAIGMLRTATRHGAARHLYSLGNLVCKGLRKIGILGKNPLEALQEKLAEKLEKLNILTPGEPLAHSLSMLGYVFPGALVRAVRQEMTKQDLPLATYRSPRFVAALGKLDRIAPSDIFLLFFSGMQELPMELVGSVQSIMNGITKEKRTAVLTTFFDEIVAEVFFNRDMPTCWLFTENIIYWLSSNVLTQIGTAVL